MEEIANNDRYELKCDTSKNRLFVTIKGLWKTRDGYIKDLEAACQKLRPGFSMLVDLLTMKPHGEIGSVHEEAQRLVLKFGLAKTAEIQTDRAILRLSLDRYSNNSGMNKEVFSSYEAAEKKMAR